MSQQYRHIVPANPHRLSCNHNLFDLHALAKDPVVARALMPILNSTMVAMIKPFYGRYAGTEGNLKTEVIDAVLLEIPDPRYVTSDILSRLELAFASMQSRPVTHLVEEAFLKCHTAEEVREAARLPLGMPLELEQRDRRELDDAVFELLGVSDPARREQLIARLYRDVALHFRAIRIVEVQKMEQRRHGGRENVSPTALAQDAWEALEPEWQKPLGEWLAQHSTQGTMTPTVVTIPDGEARLPDETNFFEATTLYFGKKPAVSHVCASRAEAELLLAIANTGLRGQVRIPHQDPECRSLTTQLSARMMQAEERFAQLAGERAGSDRLKEQVLDTLRTWFVDGRPG
jgi:hypothetical protein